ncbi:MAG: type II toxin-antitoxin system antitoxin SocA domain-containing protein [Cyanobacteria bacterium P01_F01_bin.86]
MLEQLILYFVCKTKGHITKTQLVKFLYLADLYSVKWTSKQITELDWCYYSHGPWNQDIDKALDSMAESVVIRTEGNTLLVGLKDKSLLSAEFDFSEGLQLMLENIRKEWAGAGNEKFNELLDYVYSTAPMIEAKSKYESQDRAPLNLQLERQKLLEELGV